MVEVFITDVRNKVQAKSIANAIHSNHHFLKINIDVNETDLPFPCVHSIVRVEGEHINTDKILDMVRAKGFKCHILDDKICTQTSGL